MPEDRHERPGLLRLHKQPGQNDRADDESALAVRPSGSAAEGVRGEREREDEEGRPEVPERSEVTDGRKRQCMPRVLARRIAARGDPRDESEERRGDREREREHF